MSDERTEGGRWSMSPMQYSANLIQKRPMPLCLTMLGVQMQHRTVDTHHTNANKAD